MPYEVRLKAGHPTGVFYRSGIPFTREPVTLSDEEMTTAIQAEKWLDVKPIRDAQEKTYSELLEEAASLGLGRRRRPKMEILEMIRIAKGE